jgi:hypothetical protein
MFVGKEVVLIFNNIKMDQSYSGDQKKEVKNEKQRKN